MDFEGSGYTINTFRSPYASQTEYWPRLMVPASDSFRSYHDFTLGNGMADYGHADGLKNYNSWLTGSHQVSGLKALGIGLLPALPTSGNDRDKNVLHIFKHNWLQAIDVEAGENESFVSYYMKFDHDYDVPRDSFPNSFSIHMQIWQCCGKYRPDKRNPPPLAMYVKPKPKKNDDIELVFVVRNSNSLNNYINHSFAVDDRPHFRYAKAIAGRFVVERNRWYHFAFQFSPSTNGDGTAGHFSTWLDGSRKFVYRGNWGYTPVSGVDISGKMGMNIGTYRLRDNLKQYVFFDDIKVGGQYVHHAFGD
ncbi:hypothetical protein [Synechococcus sp. MIT S9510]